MYANNSMRNVSYISVYFDLLVVQFPGNQCKQFKPETCSLRTWRYEYQIDEFKSIIHAVFIQNSYKMYANNSMQNVYYISVYFDLLVVHFPGNRCKQFKPETCSLRTWRYEYQIDEFKSILH